MNILIIEDEKRNFNRLKKLLEEMDGTFRIDGPLASIVEAVEWLRTHPAPDLILADIRLSDGLSFDVLRQTTVPSPVIFTTAYDEYAIQAFKYNSFDYLLKPISYADFLQAANKAVKWFELLQQPQEEIESIFVKSDYKLIQVELKNILYIRLCNTHIFQSTVCIAYITFNLVITDVDSSEFADNIHERILIILRKCHTIMICCLINSL